MTDQLVAESALSDAPALRGALPEGVERIGDITLDPEAHEAMIGYETALLEIASELEAQVSAITDIEDGFATDEPEGVAAVEQRAATPRPFRVATVNKSPSKEAGERTGKDPGHSTIQGWRSKPAALSSQLSLDTVRSNPDHYSNHNISPQPDHGKGMSALAAAFIKRNRSAQPDQNKKSIWSYSHNGLELRDFLESLAEQGFEGNVGERFNIVLACDSQEQKIAIETSGLLSKWNVKVRVIDPFEPSELGIPHDTAVAIMADTLDKLPAHQVYKGPKSHRPNEILEETNVGDDFVAVGIDAQSGQASAITSDAILLRQAANGSNRMVIAPRLSGNLSIAKTKTAIDNTDLAEVRSRVEAFLELQPGCNREAGSVYNYAEGLEALIEAVTGSVNSDGLVYVSGPLRTTGWLRSENLSANQGFVVSNVLEETAIRHAVVTAASSASVNPVTGSPGEHGYVLIDRAGSDTGQDGSAVEAFKSGLAEPEVGSEVAQAILLLEGARDNLRNAQDVSEKVRLVGLIKESHKLLSGLLPSTKRDYALALEIARDINVAEVDALYEDAIYFADMAFAAAPQLTSSLVEKAKAELGRGRLEEMQELLRQAAGLSTTNPEIYEVLIKAFDDNDDIKVNFLSQYAEATGNLLRYKENLSPDEIIENLEAISEALYQDAINNSADGSVYKTIIIEDLETGELRVHRLSVSEIKAIIAADSALANAEVVGMLMDYEGVEAGRIRDAQDRFFAIWQRIVPREGGTADGLPLPRDEWSDLAQGLTEKWHYRGEIYQSDDEEGVGEIEFSEITPYIQTEHSLVEYTEVETDQRDEYDDYPIEQRTSMTIGRTVNSADELSREFQIFKHQLPGHVFIVGRTRMGKTTLYENMFEQLPPMGVNFWAFDLSDKSELSELAANLKGKDLTGNVSRAVELAENLRQKGLEVIVIAPGDPESIPVSIDLFTPIEGVSIEEHIGRLVDAWITAYGGGGDSPIAHILASALRDIYAANGWPVKPAEGEPPREIRPGERSTPTFEELKDACIRRSSGYSKGTDAGNIGNYFEVRINSLQSGSFGDFLTGENAIDWDRLSESNVIFDFSRITSHDQRRFLLTALTMQATAHRIKKGLSKTLNTVWAFDEASLITQAAGEGDKARRQSVEAFTSRLRILGGYGVSIWNATQTVDGVDPLFLSQNAVTIALPLKEHSDIHRTLLSLGVREGTPLYDRLYRYMFGGSPGDAVAWRTGMDEPKEVSVARALQLSDDQMERARALKIEPPIKNAGPFSKFTNGQREKAILESMEPKNAWKRMFIGAITLAHVAHIDLPKLPEQLKKQWHAELADDPDGAMLLLHEIVKQSVGERITAVRNSYSPDRLITSVMANALGILRDEPGSKKVSAAFGVLPLRQILTSRALAGPTYGKRQNGRRYVKPAPYRRDLPVEIIEKEFFMATVSQSRRTKYPTVGDQLTELREQDITLETNTKNERQKRKKELALIAAIGKFSGASFWKSMRLITGGEVDPLLQRRLSAASLGYLASCYAPQQSQYEEVLSAATHLYSELTLAA